jgi:hypothetical protein
MVRTLRGAIIAENAGAAVVQPVAQVEAPLNNRARIQGIAQQKETHEPKPAVAHQQKLYNTRANGVLRGHHCASSAKHGGKPNHGGRNTGRKP